MSHDQVVEGISRPPEKPRPPAEFAHIARRLGDSVLLGEDFQDVGDGMPNSPAFPQDLHFDDRDR
jgi:hypothetical protein